jgi:hypothetical protein
LAAGAQCPVCVEKGADLIVVLAGAESMLAVTVFVTAPRGTGGMGRLLAALRSQLGPTDRLVVLDGTVSGPSFDPAVLPNVGKFEHIRGAGESAIHMRDSLSAMADRDITVLFEDHVVPGPCFILEVRRLFAANPAIVAVKILGRNDTSTDPWGWASFLVTFADCLHPAGGMPATLLATSAAVRTTTLLSAKRRLGTWETQLMPSLNRDHHGLGFSNDVWIDHVETSSMKWAVTEHFHNQRAIAALRVAHGHRRCKLTVRAFKDIALRRPRQVAHALEGRDEYRHFVANRWRLVLICWTATLGAIVGAWFGAGSSMRQMH